MTFSDSVNASSSILESSKSFASFFRMGKYTDFVVATTSSDGKVSEHPVHRVILANHSEFFQALFDSPFRESHEGRIQLHFEDTSQILPRIFEFMYTGKISASIKDIIPIIHAAEQLQITELIRLGKAQLSKFLSNPDIVSQYIIEIMQEAVRLQSHESVKECLDVLAANFDSIPIDTDLSFMEFPTLIQLLSHASLVLDCEYRLFKAVLLYVEKNGLASSLEEDEYSSTWSLGSNALHRDQVFELFEKISFEKMTVEQLEEASASPLVPKQLLVKGLLISLKLAKGLPVTTVGRATRQRKTRAGRDFTYRSDFDEEGVLYFLGSQGRTTRFSNPHLSKLVQCRMSSVLTGAPENLSSRQQIATCTRCEPNAWISIDFGPSMALKPTHYTLQHGHHKDNVNMRIWGFEGSTNNTDWDLISTHRDSVLGGSFGSKTWEVECGKHYRYLRIIVPTKYFVQISGFEFYGNLKSDFF
ncbi:uncharacterized protein BJ171DRAFT_581067 [Polychytrium aggregatum]|uniref:uncharacterized protein n=1 Tax=Polychytrium aggregatum TaxID=110093 RepID=UPI0022FE7777|nr:uncharacterized protein BJ171DRAFT_581067 [Polychytrium aggregatum]KAI9205386.1 hypothetical protein BJ171DRAFT_581067 [Polychytrium aggregatum]